MLQKIQLDYNLLKNIDIFGKIDKIVIGKKERLKMKGQSGKSPLGWIITIVIVLLIAGVSIAMIFGDEETISEIRERLQNSNTNSTIQTENK